MSSSRQSSASTLLGIAALLMWSTSVAFVRGLSEHLGIFLTVAFTMTLGGGIGLLHLAARRQLGALFRQPRTYLVGGLLLFLVYMVAFNLAIGRAAGHQQVVEVGLINYLWPGLTLVFAVPLQRKRATVWLLPGILIAFAGIALAMLQGHTYTPAVLAEKLQAHWGVYLLALIAAVTWALYSNFSRLWAAGAAVAATPLFLFLSGLVMLALAFVFPAPPLRWTPGVVGLLLFVAFGPTLLAYVFWDAGMRKGHLVLLASLSFLTPLFSTLISSLVLQGVKAGLLLWLACGLVIAGAVICNASVKERVSEP